MQDNNKKGNDTNRKLNEQYLRFITTPIYQTPKNMPPIKPAKTESKNENKKK